MPRKPLIYTHEYSYHINARSNNKEWFYLPMSEVWNIFCYSLNEITDRFGFSIHIFVLMNNHYHLIGNCSEKHDLGEVMAWFQKSVSRSINAKSGRINHVFGGPYKASLIKDPRHYKAVYKYVARNPVKANICSRIEDYPYLAYSPSLTSERIRGIPLKPCTQFGIDIPTDPKSNAIWLNTATSEDSYMKIRMGLMKTVFAPKDRGNREPVFDLL